LQLIKVAEAFSGPAKFLAATTSLRTGGAVVPSVAAKCCGSGLPILQITRQSIRVGQLGDWAIFGSLPAAWSRSYVALIVNDRGIGTLYFRAKVTPVLGLMKAYRVAPDQAKLVGVARLIGYGSLAFRL
jgi:hypothetical protein